MQLFHQFAVVISTALVYFIVAVAFAYKARDSKSRRSKLLWELIVLNGVLFSVVLASITLFLPQTPLNILSWIVYSLVICYVVTVEIPGYLKLSKYDATCIRGLETLRKHLVRTRYSFESLEDVKVAMKQNSEILAQVHVGGLLSDFVDFCDRMKNLDRSLWELTLNEITEAIERLSQRSKHPLPKLIDILSLAGLSFLLAQILKLAS